MKRFSHIFLLFLSATVLAWFLPWIYSFSLPDATREPFVAMSPVSGELVFTLTGDSKPRIYDLAANVYTKNQRDSLLPQLYYRDLISREELPETIAGREVSMPLLRHAEMNYTSSPREINKRTADVYLMMESMPVRVDLEDPKEVFRFTGEGVEFVDMETNELNPTRSERFTRALSDRGFRYPAVWLNANPTTRKSYDEGYLIIDSEGSLFHVKQQAGRPYVARVSMPDTVCARYAFILENTDRDYLGLVTDRNDYVYFLMRDGYRLDPLPVGKVSPESDRVAMMGNLFNIMFRFSDDSGTRWRAIDRDTHRLVGSYDFFYTAPVQSVIEDYLFPFRLDFTAYTDSFAAPRVSDISWHALWLNLLLAIVVAIVFRRRHRSAVCTVSAVAVTVLAGVFIFIPLIIEK